MKRKNIIKTRICVLCGKETRVVDIFNSGGWPITVCKGGCPR